jgi:hypothetical protein
MKKGMIGAAMLAVAMLAVTPAVAQQAGASGAPRGHAMNTLNQQPLTLQEARNAIDALLLLREKYKDYRFKGRADGPAGVIEAMKSSAIRDKIEADLKKFGFASIDDWIGKFVSVGLAVSYVRRNAGGELEKKIAEIRGDARMPEPIRKQLIAMLTALVPPKGNEEVARQLLADPEYAGKIARLMPSAAENGGKSGSEGEGSLRRLDR